jgi:DNA/RNA-binding domain of Phe-tRNA-synthetase-like protein
MINYFTDILEVERLEIKIENEIKVLIPNFKVALVHYKDIHVNESPQMLKGRLQFFQELLFFDLEEKKVTDVPGIQEWRDIFKKTGKDPNRYRHSAEALYRRIQKQNYLQSINSAIDLNNFFSLEYEIPIGIYDRDMLKEPLTIRLGQAGEEYLGLNGRSNSLHHLIVSADQVGAFGSPFVDSERTAVTEKTTSAIQIIYLKPSLELTSADQLVLSLSKMFTQVHGGTASWSIIH